MPEAVFDNTEAGFQQLRIWLDQHRSTSDAPLHACMEATGNWGLDLAVVPHGAGIQVNIVNPSRVKAYGQSELIRNKTDKLDGVLIARFCRAHRPAPWTPRATHLRELRELMRRRDGLKAPRVQKINRQKSATASTWRRRAAGGANRPLAAWCGGCWRWESRRKHPARHRSELLVFAYTIIRAQRLFALVTP